MKGIVYIMTTAIAGLIKIGQTGIKNYPERMRNLEANGYYNVSGLKKFFAIELEDYVNKENLLKEIFRKHQVGESELFALDFDLVKQLLLSFEGKIIYPTNLNKNQELDEVTKIRQQDNRFNFYKKGIKQGEKISFITDENITATVFDETKVEYEQQILKLSPLTYEIQKQKGNLTKSGAYQGAAYWTYKGIKLKDLPNITN